MKNYIDKIVSKILRENLEEKAEIITRKIFAKEGAFGDGRDRIDVAEPKGKITKADFDKLRAGKKKGETDENWGAIARVAVPMAASYVGSKLADEGEMKESEMEEGNEEIQVGDYVDIPSMEYGNVEVVKVKGDNVTVDLGDGDYDTYDISQVVKKPEFELGESEMEEGNEFSDSRCKAICGGKNSFKVGGKSYPLKGVDSEDKKSCGCKNIKESKLRFTESELIDIIEKLVKEDAEAPGIAITKKNLKTSKQINDESLKDTNKKLKDYLKDGSKEEYNPNPQHFPMGNGELAKMDKMAYVPSDAVDEYQDAFSYPGMTNLRYDEIKPDDEKINMYLKGNSKTGNAQKGKDGKDLGNVVSSKVGDKFKKNFDENLYGAEQANASYKRQSQPVDIAGNVTQKGSLKKIRGGKNSTEKSEKILNQLESLEDKKKKVVSEEMLKMQKLIGYNKKTQ